LSESPLYVLQVNRFDTLGGAARIVWTLHQAYRRRGVNSWIAVQRKFSDDPAVFPIPNDACRRPWARFWLALREKAPQGEGRIAKRLRSVLLNLGRPQRFWDVWRGREDFGHPATWRLLDLPLERPDILHGHNLHGDYFDLRALPWLSQQIPVVLTLHDAWMLTGHCAYPFDCERWSSGCGHCPSLDSHPRVRRDATAYNWRRKQTIYAQSKLYVATPSQWLLDMVNNSILSPAIIEGRVIHNGMDLSIFQPANRLAARLALGLPLEEKILLFAAHNFRRSLQKDYPTLRAAVERLGEMWHTSKVLCIALGDDAPVERSGSIEIRPVPYQDDLRTVARYYQAADLFVYATRADNLPNTVSEALACGRPVVASAVGGVPEQVKGLAGAPGVMGRYGLTQATGLMVSSENAEQMTDAIAFLLTHDAERERIGKNAALDARERFDLERQAEIYLAWYDEILRR
jgi:glycosyltransferase involved in cell wall biosynthesis